MEELNGKRILDEMVKEGLITDKTVKAYFKEGSLNYWLDSIKAKIDLLEEEIKNLEKSI